MIGEITMKRVLVNVVSERLRIIYRANLNLG